MKLKKIVSYLFVAAATLACSQGMASANELVDLLVNGLGVTETQAMGGAGSIFKVARENLAPEEFKQIDEAVPGIDGLMEAAPDSDNSTSTSMGGLTSLAKKASSSLGSAAELAQSFKQLGMDKEMIGKFMPVILDYVKNKGGETAMKLLQTALGV